MSLREDLLPIFDFGRTLIDDFGLRRYGLTVRKRVWSGGLPGKGTKTDTDLVLVPRPRIRQLTPDEIAGSGGTYQQGDYRADRITPQFDDGGYLPSDMKLVSPGLGTEILFILDGDDGTKECELVGDSFDRAFGYSLILRQTRRTP